MNDPQFYNLINLLERIATALEKLVEIQEHQDETISRSAALSAWAMGQGKHPDD